MAEYDFDAFFQTAVVPCFALVSRDGRTKYRTADTRFLEDRLKAGGNVVLPGVCGIHLAAPAFAQFLLDILDKTSLLLVIHVLRQVCRLGNGEHGKAAGPPVEHFPLDRLPSKRVVWIGQERVQHDAAQALVFRILLNGVADIVFHFAVRLREFLVHVHRNDLLLVRRELIGDILQ